MDTQRSTIPDLFNWSRPNVLSIHYGTTTYKEQPVFATELAVVWTATGQSQSFPSGSIDKSLSDPLFKYEENLLTEFGAFLSANRDQYWVHWAMRTSNFGWAHLRDRMRIHGLETSSLPSSGHLLDLSNFLEEKYGAKFAEHGRLYNLIKRNRLEHPDLLKGDIEANLAKSLELGPLRNSCYRKADRIAGLLKLECTHKIRLRRPFRMWFAGAIVALLGLLAWIVKEIAGGFLQGLFQGISKRP
jgi:hypothetical protein